MNHHHWGKSKYVRSRFIQTDEIKNSRWRTRRRRGSVLGKRNIRPAYMREAAVELKRLSDCAPTYAERGVVTVRETAYILRFNLSCPTKPYATAKDSIIR